AIGYCPRALEANRRMIKRHCSGPTKYEVCVPIGANAVRAGKSQFEVEELEIAQKRNIAATENARQTFRIRMKREMRDVERKATAATNAVEDPEAPKSQKLAAIRDNRSTERALQREQEKFSLPQAEGQTGGQQAMTGAEADADAPAAESSTLMHLRKLRSQREADADE
ncbi:hypothetical protein AAII07_58595, partial [Microvirga sp. 0TCS3.31]